MKKNYKLSVYERAALDAAIYWYRIGRGPFATRVLIKCIEMLEDKTRRQYGKQGRERPKKENKCR